MTRVISSAFVAVMLLAGVPAQAHTNPSATAFTWQALPCAVACAYWVDNGFTPCENPFPPGSWDDHVTAPAPVPAPGKIAVLEATLDSEIDYDMFLCANTDARTELAHIHHPLGQPCGGPAPSLVPMGCHEDGSTPVAGGQTVILRAYNWSDPSTAAGQYWWVMV